MDYRSLGQTGLLVSTFGFGCGAVGGLLIKGSAKEREIAVARAIDLGVTYFDTAAAYGNGQSEVNLGQALNKIRADVVIGSKIRLETDDLNDIETAVVRLVDQSLRRLGKDTIDLMQLHNLVGRYRAQQPGWLSIDDINRVLVVFERLQTQGKLRYWGINGIGDIDAVASCLATKMHSVQICHNLLNPTAAMAAPKAFPFEDQGNLIGTAAQKGIGVLAFRVLAGGALSGSAHRVANATGSVETILSSGTYDLDVRLGQKLSRLIDEGFAETLVEAAIRFAVGTPGVSSAVIGISSLEQLEDAVRIANKGAMADGAIDVLREQWADFITA